MPQPSTSQALLLEFLKKGPASEDEIYEFAYGDGKEKKGAGLFFGIGETLSGVLIELKQSDERLIKSALIQFNKKGQKYSLTKEGEETLKRLSGELEAYHSRGVERQ